MDTKIEAFLSKQLKERQSLLTAIHKSIIENDKTVTAVVEPMMRMEMIIYKDRGMMKYGLASPKNHMSLHALPIYGSKPLFNKYQALFKKAVFQKGCINFSNADELPAGILKQFIVECAGIDLIKIREEQLKAKKSKPKS